MAARPPPHRTERLLALDAFRGISIAGMILVNNPGNWKDVYRPLQHSGWNGCTPADLIFPFFLFIVGVAMALSFANRREPGRRQARLWRSIARRTLILFALGLALNGFPYYDWSTIRIPGVLQRIALCYGAAAVILLTTAVREQVIATATLLLGYWAAMTLIPVPGFGAGLFGPDQNLAAYIDHAVLAGHTLYAGWDPEGVLSTLPAIATVLSGVLAGHWLRSTRSPLERANGLFVAGNVALMVGLIADGWFPINKNLWSPAFVCFTSGVALNVFGLCYWLIDVQGYRRWATPFVIYGTNPILAYVLSSLMAKVLLLLPIPLSDGSHVHARKFIFERVFLPMASPINASLLYAIAYVLFWLGLTALLYRRRIFIKI
jgi:predicted acyltransferase